MVKVCLLIKINVYRGEPRGALIVDRISRIGDNEAMERSVHLCVDDRQASSPGRSCWRSHRASALVY